MEQQRPRSISFAPATQTPKSLRDHLVEIHKNASLRKSSDTTVSAASQLRKSSKRVPHRTNSLNPKSNRAAAVAMAAAASQAMAEKEAEKFGAEATPRHDFFPVE